MKYEPNVYVADAYKSLHNGFHANAVEADPTYDFDYGFSEDILIELGRWHSIPFHEMPLMACAHNPESGRLIFAKRNSLNWDY